MLNHSTNLQNQVPHSLALSINNLTWHTCSSGFEILLGVRSGLEQAGWRAGCEGPSMNNACIWNRKAIAPGGKHREDPSASCTYARPWRHCLGPHAIFQPIWETTSSLTWPHVRSVSLQKGWMGPALHSPCLPSAKGPAYEQRPSFSYHSVGHNSVTGRGTMPPSEAGKQAVICDSHTWASVPVFPKQTKELRGFHSFTGGCLNECAQMCIGWRADHTKEAQEKTIAVTATRMGASNSWVTTVSPVLNSAPKAATKASIASRPLIISGAPLNAMTSANSKRDRLLENFCRGCLMSRRLSGVLES